MINVIAFLHVFKNGVTTIVDRYRHNPKFVYVRDSEFGLLNHDTETIPSRRVPLKVIKSYDPRMLIGHGVEIDLFDLPKRNIVYVTCLRNPVDRMISAYNYYLLELSTIWGRDAGHIDFFTWFINKNRLLPTVCNYQYEHFVKKPNYDLLKTLCSGAIMNSHLMTDRKATVNQTELEWIYEQQRRHVHEALLLLRNKCQHVLFMDDDYMYKFDKLVKEYDIPCEPDREVVHTHGTAPELAEIKKKYVTYDDLDEDSKNLLMIHMEQDIDFYNKCKEEFK